MDEQARGWQDAPGPPQGSEGHGQQQPDDEEDYNSPLFTSVEFRLWCMKVIPCTKRFVHDWTICPFAHAGEKAVRRDPRLHTYTGIACPDMKKTGNCIRGEKCPYAHNVFEYWLHPTRYRTQLCNDGPTCRRGICFFAHSLDELRVPACKPYVSPEALARASLEAIQQNPHPLGEQLAHPAAAAAQQHAAMAAMSRSRSYGSRELPPHPGQGLGPHATPFVPRSTRSSANSCNGGGGGGGNYRHSGEPARYSAPGGSSLLTSSSSGDFSGMQGEYGSQPSHSYGSAQRFSHPPTRPANFHQPPQYQQQQQQQYQQHQQHFTGCYSHSNGGGGNFQQQPQQQQQQYKPRGQQQYASSPGGGAGRLSGNRGGGGSNGSFSSMPSMPSDPAGMDVAVAAAVAEASAAAAAGGGHRGGQQQQQYNQQQQQYSHQQQQYNQQPAGYQSQGPSPPPHQQHAYHSAHLRSPSPAGFSPHPGPGQRSFAAVQHPPPRGFGGGSYAGSGPHDEANGGGGGGASASGGGGGCPPLPGTRSGGASGSVPSTRTSDSKSEEEAGGGGGGGGGSPRSQAAGGAGPSGRASPAEPDLAQSLASLKIAMTQQQLAATAGSNHEVVITTLHQILKDAMAQQASPSLPSAFDAAAAGAAADQTAASSFAAVQQQLAAHVAVPRAGSTPGQWGGASGSPDANAGYSFGSSGATLSAGSQFFPSPRTSSVASHSDVAAAAVAAAVVASLEGKPGATKQPQQAHQQTRQDTPPPGGSPDAMACYQAALTAAAGGYRGGVLPPRLSTPISQLDQPGLEAAAAAADASYGGTSNP